MSASVHRLNQQWRNPKDILSLLMLVGGDIVLKAIAQTVESGIFIPLYRKQSLDTLSLHESASRGFVVPCGCVALSFGWIAYSFSQLLSMISVRSLMPAPERSTILVNCANGFSRVNRSWALDRLLRDHEISCPVDGSSVSVRIAIFELGHLLTPAADSVSLLGWFTIVAQLVIVAIPFGMYGDWIPLLVVASGTILIQLTCGLPQWRREKWPGRTLKKPKIVALSRGNGAKHIMILIGEQGSPDLEAFAVATGHVSTWTQCVIFTTTACWCALLLCVQAMGTNAWFLLGAGTMEMLQNVYAAGAPRAPNTTGLALTPYARRRPILSKSLPVDDVQAYVVAESDALRDVSPLTEWLAEQEAEGEKMPLWLDSMSESDGAPHWLAGKSGDTGELRGVHGALQELDRWVPGAGLALLQIFFPGAYGYNPAAVRDNVDKIFWARASYTKHVRQRAEKARRAVSLAPRS